MAACVRVGRQGVRSLRDVLEETKYKKLLSKSFLRPVGNVYQGRLLCVVYKMLVCQNIRLSSSLPPFVVVVITVTGIHKITK